MAEAPLTLGTAGHIDHGKTALIRALTGKDTDRLPEEQKRGISIELGYARLTLPSGRTLSVVDVPGHERFVRTMVAGATGIDMFLLCIAADDGVMPQTREHMAVLRQLGVERGVVAVTKSDVADPELAMAEADELVPGIEAIPVSALTGLGIEALRAALDRVAAAAPSRGAGDGGPMRLHVDRSFTLKGIGTVVTGTLWSGSVAASDQVEILPAARRARVRSVQVHDASVERAAAGQRVALNLVGVARDEVGRGDVVVSGWQGAAAHIVDARIATEPGVQIEAGTRLHVHHGTRESPGRIYPLGEGFAQLRLESPLVAARGDRVILRQLAPPDTIGGGTIVDPAARRHSGSAEIVERLTRLERGAPADGASERGASERGASDGGASDGGASDGGASHRGASGASGASDRGASGASDRGRPALAAADPALIASAGAILELLRADAEQPRADGDLVAAAHVDPDDAAAAFRLLEAEGSAVRLARNLHFARDALEPLVARVVAICERDGAATIASVRDELGTSRRYAQAILEHLDATKVTLRRGDDHVLRRR